MRWGRREKHDAGEAARREAALRRRIDELV